LSNLANDWRQVALCAWGSQFLAGHNDLESWYRHGIFWDARQQFKQLNEPRLLADDFTAWLCWLKHRGATRLTLHWASSAAHLPNIAGIQWGRWLMGAHFSNSCELWALALETPLTDSYFDGVDSQLKDMASKPAAYYAGDIDCYVCIDTVLGFPEIAPINWTQTANHLQAALFAPNSRRSEAWPPAPGLLILGHRADSEWANLPILPPSATTTLPNTLLLLLQIEHGRFANDTHCKNEGNLYAMANTQEAATIEQWGSTLDHWLDTVQLAAANEVYLE
jgi:hypothetical protein